MKPRHLFPVLLALSAFVVLARGHDAQAQKDPRGEAKKHYGEGKRLYETGEYDKAIAEFKAADQLAPSGVNDFNIALAYEQLGKPAEAIRYYQSYLTRMPSADNRADVQASIDALEKQQSAEDAARQAEAARLADEEAARKAREADEARKIIPPDGNGGGTTQPQGSTGDPELDRVAAIDVGSVRQQREASMPPPEGGGGGGVATGGGGGAVPPPAPTGEPKKSKPIYKQWWFWVVAGVSAYVLISILSSSSDNPQPGALMLPDAPAPQPAVGYGWKF